MVKDQEPNWCPTLRPSEAEFRRPFVDYVSEVFRKDPGLPMFKVVPPAGWRPRRNNFPDLKSVCIQTPIRQHAFGQRGAYRCMFVEHKPLQVSEFRDITLEEADRIIGHKGQAGSAAAGGVVNHTARRLESRRALHDGDDIMERSFWSSVTLNPPLYGADTPYSFFDQHLPYGWNLRNLGDLLKTKDVPEIPGVTTPMTYFGMWRSFFGWHKEDVDLYSINFHHFGAPKVWYCISPDDQAKFERMASGLFPEEAKECSDFIRHKDILISPNLLRTNNITYSQAKQQPGEFIVLNAAAYHGGFNLGFNCAEAVNFATEDWIKVGKLATRCMCKKDCVRLSMRLFDPDWSSESEDESEGTNFSGSDEEEESSCSRGCIGHHRHDNEKEGPVVRTRAGLRALEVALKRGAASSGQGKRGRPHSHGSHGSARLAHNHASKKRRPTSSRGSIGGPPISRLHEALNNLKHAAGSLLPADCHQQQPHAAAATATSSRHAKPAGHGGSGSSSISEPKAPPTLPQPRTTRQRSASAASTPASMPGLPPLSLTARPKAEQLQQEEVDGPPQALVALSPSARDKFFHVVQRLKRPAKRPGHAVLRWLKEGEDGLFRPQPVHWEERPGLLISIRTQLVSAKDCHGNELKGAALYAASTSGSDKGMQEHTYKLLTLRSRILDNDLE